MRVGILQKITNIGNTVDQLLGSKETTQPALRVKEHL